MMEDKDFEEKTLVRKELFNGRIIKVVVDEVQLPNGKIGKRELVFHPGGAAIIPITKEGKLVLVKQFRKPMEKVILEIPAGKLEVDEQQYPMTAAKRELEEETGYQAAIFEFVTSMYVSPGFSDELLSIYYAQELEKVVHPRPQDEDEMLELHEITLEEAKGYIKEGLICDAKTIFAVQYWELQQLKARLKEGHR